LVYYLDAVQSTQMKGLLRLNHQLKGPYMLKKKTPKAVKGPEAVKGPHWISQKLLNLKAQLNKQEARYPKCSHKEVCFQKKVVDGSQKKQQAHYPKCSHEEVWLQKKAVDGSQKN
ncbi:MAG: hypothetical protein MJE68_15065, partial [Proteobacteria bacterium]|nr:hypothetical protein [Pseudomonadota bacterium]